MQKTLLIAAAAVWAWPTTAQETSIKRWNGSKIITAEVDATVMRLMRAAEVTGVGIAILNDGNVA